MTGTEICAALVWGMFCGFWLFAEIAVYVLLARRARRLDAGYRVVAHGISHHTNPVVPLSTAQASGRRLRADFLRVGKSQ